MRTLVSIVLTFVLLAGIGSAAIEWRDDAIVRALDEVVEPGAQVSAERQAARLREAAARTTVTGVVYARLGGVLRQSAEMERDPQRRVDLFCEGLAALGEAVRREPQNGAYVVNWANLRQLLGSVQCPQPLTTGDYREASRRALSINPTDTRIIYAAAQIAGWAGDEAEMRRLLQSFLTLKVELRPSEQEFVYSRLRGGADLAGIIPPRFPQALVWSRLVRSRDPELFDREKTVFSTLQRTAVEESAARFEDGAIPLDLHRRRLLHLAEAAADAPAQQLIDRRLAEMFRRTGNREQADYYESRSQLEEIPIVRTVLKSDTRPTANALVGWGGDEAVSFDEFFSSIGFFVPEGRSARVIQLVSSGNAARIEGAVVQVLASNDNQNWLQVSDRAKITTFPLGDLSAVEIRLEEGGYRYWKVHFGSAERTRVFKNSLSSLVKVYGLHGFD